MNPENILLGHVWGKPHPSQEIAIPTGGYRRIMEHEPFVIFDFRMTIWRICALTREAAERERREREKPRARLMRKLGEEAELKHKQIFDFRMAIWEECTLASGVAKAREASLRQAFAKQNFRRRE